MIVNYRPVLNFLYVLLFLSFVGMALGRSVGSWISTTYGGWVTLEAVLIYGAYLAGLIWLIRRLSRLAGIEVSKTANQPPYGMTEMEFIRAHMKTQEYVAGQPEMPPQEPESEPRLKS